MNERKEARSTVPVSVLVSLDAVKALLEASQKMWDAFGESREGNADICCRANLAISNLRMEATEARKYSGVPEHLESVIEWHRKIQQAHEECPAEFSRVLMRWLWEAQETISNQKSEIERLRNVVIVRDTP